MGEERSAMPEQPPGGSPAGPPPAEQGPAGDAAVGPADQAAMADEPTTDQIARTDRPGPDGDDRSPGDAVDRTRIDGALAGTADTADTAPVRWSGAAPVPAPEAKPAARLAWRRPRQRLDPTLELPVEERDGPPPPPVDPWADAAPPWDPLALPAPAHPPTPPPVPEPPRPWPLPPPPPAGPPGAQVHRPAPPTVQPPRVAPVPSKVKKDRRGRPPPAPPGWGAPPVAPPGYELRRRKRRWPRRLTMLLLTFGCCCACPAYYLTPIWQQYPATAAVPAAAADLTLRDDRAARQTVRELKTRARTQHWLAEDTFAGVYDGGPGWQVVVYGTTGFRLAPGSDLETELARLAEEYGLGDVSEVDAGPLGGHQRCGLGASPGDDPDLVLCAWADHGSLGVATFSAGSVEQSAHTLRALRAAIIIRE